MFFFFLIFLPVDFIGRGTDQEIAGEGVVGDVTRVFGDTCFVVFAVLCVEFNVSIGGCEGEFRVIFCENSEFDDLRVDTTQTFHGEFLRFEDLNRWCVDTCCDDVVLIVGDFDLVACDGEIEILDDFNATTEVLIVFE